MSGEQDKQSPDSVSSSPTFRRMEDQIEWYDRKSAWNQRCYKVLKTISIMAAASVPVLALSGEKLIWTTASAGVLLVILEGLQQLNQYHANWLSYRSTTEALIQEKHLYLAGAGPYLDVDGPLALLAERVEAILSKERSAWVNVQVQAANKVKSPGQPGQ